MRNTKISSKVLTGLAIVLFFGFVTPQNIPASDLDLIKQKDFNVTSGGDFVLETEGGDVTVNSWEENRVEVKIFGNSKAKKKFTFSFESDGDFVKVTGKKHGSSIFNWFSSEKLRYEVLVPKEFDLDIRTAGGDVKIRDIKGGVVLTTSGGDIKVKSVQGSVEAKTSGGDIRINDAQGEISLKTSGGDINCYSVNGELIAKTSGGDIDLKDVSGKINSSTSGGDISLVYIGENEGIELYTSGGDIKISVPDDFSADINLKTVGGEIQVDLENLRDVQTSRFSFTASAGNPEYPLIAKTTGGDITIVAF